MDVSRPPHGATQHAPHTSAGLRSWLPLGPARRVRGLLAGVVLASGVTTVAVAQQPAAHRRAATLLPPQAADPGEVAVIARGAIEDGPAAALASTPVPRPGNKTGSTGGPAWLNGIDANVVPASGKLTTKPYAESPTPSVVPAAPTSARLAPPPMHVPVTEPVRSPRTTEKAGPGAELPNTPPGASRPLRGTAPNGAPVFAGPPAYRWYGYGTVTPGANPFAPTGQYPKASANWYTTTGATPGAFPVPVVNPYRPTPGSEPPTYVSEAPPRNTVKTVQPEPIVVREPSKVVPTASEHPSDRFVVRPLPTMPTANAPGLPAPDLQPPFNPVGSTRAATTSSPTMAPKPLPTVAPTGPFMKPVTTPPAPLPAGAGLGALPAQPIAPPVGVPAIVPPPVMPPVAPVPVSVLPVKSAKPAEPVAVVPPPSLPPLPPVPSVPPPTESKRAIPGLVPAASVSATPVIAKPLTTTKPAVKGSPAALPASVTEDVRWQTTPESAVPRLPGTWVPATTAPRVPGLPVGEPGATNTTLKAITARAQMPDDRQPDPAAALVHALCRGRADGVDVRWTGSKRLAVCFETRTEPEAKQLVKDISARPELGPLQIDFCVLVK